MSDSPDTKRELLRHTIATLAYRGAKALRDAPAEFAGYRAGETTRTPVAILAHIGDLLAWALTQAEGNVTWKNAPPLAWDVEVERFFTGLAALDAYLASDKPLGAGPELIFQGAIADALTHVGQLTLLRRMAGSPIRGESYFRAEIVAGRVGPEQMPPRREFD
ncbi:MAG TPA: hypothetical protein VEZ11_16520 [Thermoanaerobaculia bacterium]|nr:hypothetical protein [Thermoanaerobaculia bacterium]